jgi:hypothetical protein
MGQLFIEQCSGMTFDPDRVARVLKPRFCYKHLTHSGSASGYKYTERFKWIGNHNGDTNEHPSHKPSKT